MKKKSNVKKGSIFFRIVRDLNGRSSCRQICNPKRNQSFSWSSRGSKYCKHCDVLIIINVKRCPCCGKLLRKHLRDYIKKFDRL